MHMGQKISRGASGAIELKYLWTETSSTHLETESSASLIVLDPEELVLTQKYEKTNFYKSHASEVRSEKYKISVEMLIELIVKHGTQV
jgi:hypothetical protein